MARAMCGALRVGVALTLAALVAGQSATPTVTVSPASGCLVQYIRVENTPGVANMNFYEVYAYDHSNTNVALNKPCTCLSVWAAGNECAKAVDGIPSESGYYNSQGTGSSEFLQINLGAPVLLASLVFINRNPQVSGCWTPPAAWTSAGIANTCDTRSFNSTLRAMNGSNSTVASMRLTQASSQTLYLQCPPSASPTRTSSATAAVTPSSLPTASLTRGVSASATATVTALVTPSITASVPPSQSPSNSAQPTVAPVLQTGAVLNQAIGTTAGSIWQAPAGGCANATFTVTGGGGGSGGTVTGGSGASFSVTLALPPNALITAWSAGGGLAGGSGGGAAALVWTVSGAPIAVAGGGGGSNYKTGGSAGAPGGCGSNGADYSATGLGGKGGCQFAPGIAGTTNEVLAGSTPATAGSGRNGGNGATTLVSANVLGGAGWGVGGFTRLRPAYDGGAGGGGWYGGGGGSFGSSGYPSGGGGGSSYIDANVTSLTSSVSFVGGAPISGAGAAGSLILTSCFVPTPSSTVAPTATPTATASLSRGVSASQTASKTPTTSKTGTVTQTQTMTPSASAPVTGCFARYLRIQNTPGVANMNMYELIASNATGGNVALGCATSALSWTGAGNAAYRMTDGIIGEVSYYNSAGTSANEYLQVDLGSGNCANAVGAPQQVYNITFVNRAALTPTCWTPPAAWTAAGIARSCDTRAINNTLTVLDVNNATLAQVSLTAALVQSFPLRCSGSPTPSVTPASTPSGTSAMTASLSQGASASVTATTSNAPTSSPTSAATVSPAPPLPQGSGLGLSIGSTAGAAYVVPASGCNATFTITGGGGGSGGSVTGGSGASFSVNLLLDGGALITAQSSGGGLAGGSGGGASALFYNNGRVIAVAGGGGGSNYKSGGNGGAPDGCGSNGVDYSATSLGGKGGCQLAAGIAGTTAEVLAGSGPATAGSGRNGGNGGTTSVLPTVFGGVGWGIGGTTQNRASYNGGAGGGGWYGGGGGSYGSSAYPSGGGGGSSFLNATLASLVSAVTYVGGAPVSGAGAAGSVVIQSCIVPLASTPSITPTPPQTPSPTAAITTTPAATASASPAATPSATVGVSASTTAASSGTAASSMTAALTASRSSAITATTTVGVSASASTTAAVTASTSFGTSSSITPSGTVAASSTPAQSPTATAVNATTSSTPAPSLTANATASISSGLSASTTPTPPSTPDKSLSNTETASPTVGVSASMSSAATISASSPATASTTPTKSLSTGTTPSKTPTLTASQSVVASATTTATRSHAKDVSDSKTAAVTPSASALSTVTPSLSPSFVGLSGSPSPAAASRQPGASASAAPVTVALTFSLSIDYPTSVASLLQEASIGALRRGAACMTGASGAAASDVTVTSIVDGGGAVTIVGAGNAGNSGNPSGAQAAAGAGAPTPAPGTAAPAVGTGPSFVIKLMTAINMASNGAGSSRRELQSSVVALSLECFNPAYSGPQPNPYSPFQAKTAATLAALIDTLKSAPATSAQLSAWQSALGITATGVKPSTTVAVVVNGQSLYSLSDASPALRAAAAAVGVAASPAAVAASTTSVAPIAAGVAGGVVVIAAVTAFIVIMRRRALAQRRLGPVRIQRKVPAGPEASESEVVSTNKSFRVLSGSKPSASPGVGGVTSARQLDLARAGSFRAPAAAGSARNMAQDDEHNAANPRARVLAPVASDAAFSRVALTSSKSARVAFGMTAVGAVATNPAATVNPAASGVVDLPEAADTTDDATALPEAASVAAADDAATLPEAASADTDDAVAQPDAASSATGAGSGNVLPEGWVAVKAGDNTYYLNSATQETTWVRPA